MNLRVLASVLLSLAIASSPACILTEDCEESFAASGSVQGVQLRPLALDPQGAFYAGSLLELFALQQGALLALLSLAEDPEGEDAARVAFVSNPDIVLEAYEPYPGAHMQLLIYNLDGNAVQAGDLIDVIDASAMNADREEEGPWQEGFREVVDGIRAGRSAVALALFVPGAAEGEAAVPPVFREQAVFAEAGTTVIDKAYSGLGRVTTLDSDASGPLGSLSPLWFTADLEFGADRVELDGACVSGNSSSDRE